MLHLFTKGHIQVIKLFNLTAEWQQSDQILSAEISMTNKVQVAAHTIIFHKKEQQQQLTNPIGSEKYFYH